MSGSLCFQPVPQLTYWGGMHCSHLLKPTLTALHTLPTLRLAETRQITPDVVNVTKGRSRSGHVRQADSCLGSACPNVSSRRQVSTVLRGRSLKWISGRALCHGKKVARHVDGASLNASSTSLRFQLRMLLLLLPLLLLLLALPGARQATQAQRFFTLATQTAVYSVLANDGHVRELANFCAAGIGMLS